jgi:hypothetical protein
MNSPSQPTDQSKLIDAVKDPQTIAKAVEGSMDKRAAVLQPTEAEELRGILKKMGLNYGVAVLHGHLAEYAKTTVEANQNIVGAIEEAHTAIQSHIKEVVKSALQAVLAEMPEKYEGYGNFNTGIDQATAAVQKVASKYGIELKEKEI